MGTNDRVAEVEALLARQKEVVREEFARLRGLEAELEALRSIADESALAEMPRTEAIVMVLRQAEGTLSPKEIQDRLRAAGRVDELRSITATLDHLVKRGAVERPGRGRYVAV